MARNLAKVCFIAGFTEQFMRGLLKMGKNTDLGNIIFQMGIFMKANGEKAKETEKENISLKMGWLTKEYLVITNL